MKSLLFFLCSVTLVFALIGTADALSITGTLTADNHYGLFYGDTGQLHFVGRNEVGPDSSGLGLYNWSEAETYTFNMDSGDYIYVAAWCDRVNSQAWIGEFGFDGGTLLTNTSDWEFISTLGDWDDYSLAPSTSDLLAAISSGTWAPVMYAMDHGVQPWGSIGGISADSDWIWGSSICPANSGFQVFRTQVGDPVPQPEPATVFLLGSGLLGLGTLRRRWRKSSPSCSDQK